ncbi:MAG: hypothetical protein ACRYGK_04930 [Janthinobacterium lividum]
MFIVAAWAWQIGQIGGGNPGCSGKIGKHLTWQPRRGTVLAAGSSTHLIRNDRSVTKAAHCG